MDQIKKSERENALAEGSLGLRLEGSAQEGHEIIIERDGALTEIFKTDDPDQADALMFHCLKALRGSEAGDAGRPNDERHFMLSIINDVAPRDGIERMLAVQMAATHVATIRTAGMLACTDVLKQYEAYDRAFNKLTRTFAAQVEALRKYRNGGKQTVTVQHVNVEDGGQAIVGNVETGGRGSFEK